MDRNLSPRLFDASEPQVAVRPLNLDGATTLPPGDLVPEGILTDGQKLRLWMCSHIMYAKDYHPTPMEGDIDPATVVVDDVAVEQAVAEFEAAQPHTVSSSHIGGGYYLLTPSWDEALAEKVQGKDLAATRADELLASAPEPVTAQPEVVQDASKAEVQPETQPDPDAQPQE